MMSLTSLTIPDARFLGAKAASLSRLAALGFRISPGYVFDASYCESLFALAGLEDRIQWLQENGPLLKEAYVLDLGQEIINRIQAIPLPQTFEQDLERCFNHLSGDGTSLICRSSCLLEDSEYGAYPGVFQSVAGLTTIEDLWKAVRSCVSSLFQPKALRYWLRMRRQSGPFGMGLLIQRLVNSRCTGVMFFEHPENILVEVVSGQGALLMAGQTAPLGYRKTADHSWKKMNGREEADLLRDEHLQELARVGELASVEWKSAVDIEFGFLDGESTPYLFQCRTVTEQWPFNNTRFSRIHSKRLEVQGVSCSPGLAQGIGVDLSADQNTSSLSNRSIGLVEYLREEDYELIFEVQGIVSEGVGSQLNHLSIACRELGIPYVSGAHGARAKFHGQSIAVDGTKGTVAIISDDFPVFDKRATVASSDVLKPRVAYWPVLQDQQEAGAILEQPLVFTGGVYLMLEALYNGETEPEIGEYMVKELNKAIENSAGHEGLKIRIPQVSTEESSLLRQLVREGSFSQGRVERLFRQVSQEVGHHSGRKLFID